MTGFKPGIIQITLQKSVMSPTDKVVTKHGLARETQTWLRALPY